MCGAMEADPFEQKYWNLDQYLIWLASRDPAAVLNATDRPNSRTNQPIGWREYRGSNVDRQKVEMEAVRAIKCAFAKQRERERAAEEEWRQAEQRDNERIAAEKRQHLSEPDGSAQSPQLARRVVAGKPLLRQLATTLCLEFNGEWFTPDDPEWFADCVIEFEGEPTFAALLVRTTEHGRREKVRPRFNPQSIARLYRAPTPSDIRDRPDVENPDVGPFIAYYDVLNWLAERISLREPLPIDEAGSRAEKTIRSICMTTPEKLTMWGFRKGDPAAELKSVTPQAWQGLWIYPLPGQPETDLKALGRRREYGAATKGEYGPEIWTGLCFDRKQFVVAFVTGADNGTKRVPLPNLQIANSDKSRAAAWALQELYGTSGYPRNASDKQLLRDVNAELCRPSTAAHFQGVKVSRDTISRLLGRRKNAK
jgi:hypothetical protein